MKNAFLILAHKYPDQLTRLVNYLSAEEDHVFIHIDSRSTQLFQEISSRFKEKKNVHLLNMRYKVYWGSYNQIMATVELICSAESFAPFDYFHLISGQDIPLMGIKEMRSFLEKNKGAEFIECFALPFSGWNNNGGLNRMQFYWLDGKLHRATGYLQLFLKILRFKRSLSNYKFYGGTNWFTLSGGLISWMVNYFRNNKKYLRRFRYTRNADEIFVQTLIMMSPFAKNLSKSFLRHINWQDGPEYPRTLRTEDFDKIVADKESFFARKFDEKTDAHIIDLVYGKLPPPGN